MLPFENRRGAYLKVREHRKRRKVVFAGHLGRNPIRLQVANTLMR